MHKQSKKWSGVQYPLKGIFFINEITLVNIHVKNTANLQSRAGRDFFFFFLVVYILHEWLYVHNGDFFFMHMCKC